jgi:hypothetical protein
MGQKPLGIHTGQVRLYFQDKNPGFLQRRPDKTVNDWRKARRKYSANPPTHPHTAHNLACFFTRACARDRHSFPVSKRISITKAKKNGGFFRQHSGYFPESSG